MRWPRLGHDRGRVPSLALFDGWGTHDHGRPRGAEMARDRLLFRISALFAVRAMVPQVEDPDTCAARLTDEGVVAPPPLGQFKPEQVRDVGPVVTDEAARPAVLGNGIPGRQGVRPSACLERREALELGPREAFLVVGSRPRPPTPLLTYGRGLRGVADAEELRLGHADRLRSAEPSA